MADPTSIRSPLRDRSTSNRILRGSFKLRPRHEMRSRRQSCAAQERPIPAFLQCVSSPQAQFDDAVRKIKALARGCNGPPGMHVDRMAPPHEESVSSFSSTDDIDEIAALIAGRESETTFEAILTSFELHRTLPMSTQCSVSESASARGDWISQQPAETRRNVVRNISRRHGDPSSKGGIPSLRLFIWIAALGQVFAVVVVAVVVAAWLSGSLDWPGTERLMRRISASASALMTGARDMASPLMVKLQVDGQTSGTLPPEPAPKSNTASSPILPRAQGPEERPSGGNMNLSDPMPPEGLPRSGPAPVLRTNDVLIRSTRESLDIEGVHPVPKGEESRPTTRLSAARSIAAAQSDEASASRAQDYPPRENVGGFTGSGAERRGQILPLSPHTLGIRLVLPPAATARPEVTSTHPPAPGMTGGHPVSASSAQVRSDDTRLLKRAALLLNKSDISGARLILEKAAAGGSARAAYMLAQTYDPQVLPEKWSVVGIRGDPGRARDLYSRAQFGGVHGPDQRAEAR